MMLCGDRGIYVALHPFILYFQLEYEIIWDMGESNIFNGCLVLLK